jgi:lysozyme
VAGDAPGARAAMLDWARPAALLSRRQREQALFFDGVWTADGTALVYDVAKPAYRPAGAKRIAIAPVIARLFAGEPGQASPRRDGGPQPNWLLRGPM